MINVNKLKGKVVENGYSLETFSEKIGINNSTLYRKMKGGGENFSIGEVQRIIDVLNLSIEDVNDIFFSQIVA